MFSAVIFRHLLTATKMNQYEIDTERANLREQIIMAREHANRTSGEMREADLSHMNAAIVALRELNHKSK